MTEFEKAFKRQIGARYGITASNGTAALELGMLALGIGPGDEVIVPGYTFAAAPNAVLKVRATPVYVDVDPDTWCLDPSAVERSVTRRTKAIIAVHIYGNVCAMSALGRISRKHGLYLIEDAAEAPFSMYADRCAGSFGDIGCYSFQATKTITMGEGGFVSTPHLKLYESMRLIRNHGMQGRKRYWHYAIGYNFRLTNLQAAVGCGQLERKREIVRRKALILERYRKGLSGVAEIVPQKFEACVEPVVWTFAFLLKAKKGEGARNRIMEKLLRKGIETRPGFYSFHDMPVYKAPSLQVADSLGKNIVTLPSFCSIRMAEIDYICAALKSALGRH